MSAEASTTKLSGDELKQALRKQVEYYFSEQNLSQDMFLVQQMDSQYWVNVDVILGFKRIKSLTSEATDIVAAVQGSKVVEVDPSGNRLRPCVNNKRHTLIVRDIPTEAGKEEVLKLFTNPGCPTVREIRAEVGNNWFLNFDDEESTMKALEFARTQTYNGDRLKVRVKSESVVKSTSYMPMGMMMYDAGNMYGMKGMYGGDRRQGGQRQGRNNRNQQRGQQQGAGMSVDVAQANTNGNARAGQGQNQQSGQQQQGAQNQQAGQQPAGGKKNKRKGRDGHSAPSLTPQNFPALPVRGDGGYAKGNPTVYSLQEMRDLFRSMPAEQPQGVDVGCPVVLSVPDTVMEAERPERDRRYSVDLDSKYAKQRGERYSARSSLTAGPSGSIAEEDDVLADAAAAVAEVEAAEAQEPDAAQIEEAKANGNAKISYASLLKKASA